MDHSHAGAFQAAWAQAGVQACTHQSCVVCEGPHPQLEMDRPDWPEAPKRP